MGINLENWLFEINRVGDEFIYNPLGRKDMARSDTVFLAGHWTTEGIGHSGVPGSALTGRRAAELIIKESNKQWIYKLIRS